MISIISDILKEIELEFPDFEYYNKEISKGLNRYESLFGVSLTLKKKSVLFFLYSMQMFMSLILLFGFF